MQEAEFKKKCCVVPGVKSTFCIVRKYQISSMSTFYFAAPFMNLLFFFFLTLFELHTIILLKWKHADVCHVHCLRLTY